MFEDPDLKRGVNRLFRRLHFLSFVVCLVVPILLTVFSLMMMAVHFMCWLEGAEIASPARVARLGFLAIFNIIIVSVQFIWPNTFPGAHCPPSEEDPGKWTGFERWAIGEVLLFATVIASLMGFGALIIK